MDSEKNSVFYLKRSQETKESVKVLNSCLYQHNIVDKQLQDILFNYVSLADYNKHLSNLRKLYKQAGIRQARAI